MTPLGATASLGEALSDAHGAVEGLAKELRRLGERHSADQDVMHMSRTLGAKLDAAADSLAAEGERLGESLSRTGANPGRSGGPLSGLREKASELAGSRPGTGAMLLGDLRRFLSAAADASVSCVVLSQGAKAAKDAELVDAAAAAQETVERTHRWALTRLKVTAPQVLTGP